MSFYLIDYKAYEKQYSKYDGHVAIVLQWWPNNDEPFDERYTIITPLMACDYKELVESITKSWDCHGYHITFYHPTRPRPLIFDTTNMPAFTERRPIKPPVSRYDKWGERKVYAWSNGRWALDHWEKRNEEDQ
jgi:hypothetical protein